MSAPAISGGSWTSIGLLLRDLFDESKGKGGFIKVVAGGPDLSVDVGQFCGGISDHDGAIDEAAHGFGVIMAFGEMQAGRRSS